MEGAGSPAPCPALAARIASRDALAKELKRRAIVLLPQTKDWSILHFRRRLLDPAFRAVLSLSAQEA